MGYRQLVCNGTGCTAIQTFFARGDMIATTIRIPENLKDTVSEEALLSGMDVPAYIGQYVISNLVNQAGEAR